MLRLLFFVFCVLTGPAAMAQTAPSASEIAVYEGLFRAAHHGDVAAIRQLASEGADVDARDATGRAPIHVAAFAFQDDALRALAEAARKAGLQF